MREFLRYILSKEGQQAVAHEGTYLPLARPVAERATDLISLAHPDFREDLEREAREFGLIPRHFW